MTTLMVFTRYPEAGRAKTRLIPALGPEGAAELQMAMTRHTLDQARRFADAHDARIEVHFEGGDPASRLELFGDDLDLVAQVSGDLGARLTHAFERAHALGGPVLVIGADCPELTSEHLVEAARALEEHDLVLGPAIDGGYTLLGTRRFERTLFEDVPWSTERVLATTLTRSEAAGLSATLLRPLRDLDTPDDLLELREVLDRIGIRAGSPR